MECDHSAKPAGEGIYDSVTVQPNGPTHDQEASVLLHKKFSALARNLLHRSAFLRVHEFLSMWFRVNSCD
jgi:hypothetical protein